MVLRRWRRHAHDAVVSWLRGSDRSVDALVDARQPVLSRVYGAIVAGKRRREGESPQRVAADVPVLSVGNFTFGATGKTPFAMFLAEYALERRQQQVPLLLSRGYGDDEWRLFASRYPRCELALGGDRVAAGRKKVEQLQAEGKKLSCVILDDGLQQWRLRKDLEIVMVDALHPLGNGRLIPCGSLRERPREALRRADVVIVHHADLLEKEKARALVQTLRGLVDESREPVVGTSRLKVKDLACATWLLKRDGTKKPRATAALNGRVVVVLCGVGNPTSVGMVVEKMARWQRVSINAYPDHHAFSEGDVGDILEYVHQLEQESGSNVLVITTEKDFDRSTAAMNALADKLDLRVLICELELLDNALQVKHRINACLDNSSIRSHLEAQ